MKKLDSDLTYNLLTKQGQALMMKDLLNFNKSLKDYTERFDSFIRGTFCSVCNSVNHDFFKFPGDKYMSLRPDGTF